jgi:HEAT repeat protein
VRGNIALALGELGERGVVPQLVGLLSNKEVSEYVRGNIALALGELGEHGVAPQLVGLLSNEQVSKSVCARIADMLPLVVENEAEIVTMTSLLPTSNSNIANSIYLALWTVSRRLGLRILVSNESGEEHVTIVRLN